MTRRSRFATGPGENPPAELRAFGIPKVERIDKRAEVSPCLLPLSRRPALPRCRGCTGAGSWGRALRRRFTGRRSRPPPVAAPRFRIAAPAAPVMTTASEAPRRRGGRASSVVWSKACGESDPHRGAGMTSAREASESAGPGSGRRAGRSHPSSEPFDTGIAGNPGSVHSAPGPRDPPCGQKRGGQDDGARRGANLRLPRPLQCPVRAVGGPRRDRRKDRRGRSPDASVRWEGSLSRAGTRRERSASRLDRETARTGS